MGSSQDLKLNSSCSRFFDIHPSAELYEFYTEIWYSTGAPNEDIVQNHLNIACWTYFSIFKFLGDKNMTISTVFSHVFIP